MRLMSQRLKLIVAYDGAPFSGWQSQANRNGVQDHLERAFERVSGAAVRVHGAGRTDAGVHALAQCAHVDLANNRVPFDRWLPALNAVLPPTIRVLRCQHVANDFHARFSAKGKVYRYRIWSATVLPPLEYGRAWHVTAPVHFATMTCAAATFVDTHAFGAFAARRGKKELDPRRTIRSVAVRQHGSCITLEIDGDGFLYKMVRLIVGALVQHATGKIALPKQTMKLSSSRTARPRLVAAAPGWSLVLV